MTTAATPVRPASNVLPAAGWMIGALLAFSAMAIAGRKAQETLETVQMMFGRAVIGTIILSIIVLARGERFSDLATHRLGMHLLRNVIHYASQFSWFHALTLIPLATLFAVEFTCPLWVALIAPIVLGEKLTSTRIAAALIGFAGIIAIVQPGTQPMTAGLALGLFSALGYALGMLCTKSLTRTEPVFRVLFLMHAIQIVFGLIPMWGRWIVPTPNAVLWVAVVACVGLCAHYCMTRAFALADAIIVAPMDFLRLPLIGAVGALAYGEQLDSWVLIGAAVIVVANFLNIWGERRVVT